MMKTQLTNVVSNIGDAVDQVGKISTIHGVKLEKADPILLDVRDGDFDEHVAMQPAAIAYFGTLKKIADRQLENRKSSYERWQKRKYHEAQQALSATMKTKPTKADIEGYMLINNEKDIEKHEDDLESLQEQADTLGVWYEAWRQKSFSLREIGQVRSDEIRTQPYISGEDDEKEPFVLSKSLQRVCEIRKEHERRKLEGGTE